MNNNLKNLNIQPDDSVWQKLSATLHRRVLIRRTLWIVASLAVVGAVVVAFLPKSQPQSDSLAMAPTISPAPIAVQSATPTQMSPSAQPIADKATSSTPQTPSMQLEIATEVITVEDQEPALPTEIINPEYPNDEDDVTIIGGEDGPTAILVTNEQPQAELPSTATPESPSVAQALVATPTEEPIVEATTPVQPKSNPLPVNKESAVWIPNIIIPNGDVEENRYFRVRANEEVSDYRISIYSRSGHLVFKSNDINSTWDGTKEGVQLPQAAYVYVIQYRDRRGVGFTEKGTITLVR